MRPGYYIVTKDRLLKDEETPHRVKIRRGDWLITDGEVLGRFDKEIEFDWLPLEWIRGNPIVLDEVFNELEPIVIKVPPTKLDKNFQEIMFIEPGEPIPEMPTPSLTQLGAYLHSRRMLVVSTYDRRS